MMPSGSSSWSMRRRPKGKSRLAIQQELAELKPNAAADYRLRLAYAYASIARKEIPNALGIVTAIASEHPDCIAAHHAKAWLLFVSRKPSNALAELEAIAKCLETPATSPRPKRAFRGRPVLGHGAGLLRRTWHRATQEAGRSEAKGRVLKTLTTPQRAGFLRPGHGGHRAVRRTSRQRPGRRGRQAQRPRPTKSRPKNKSKSTKPPRLPKPKPTKWRPSSRRSTTNLLPSTTGLAKRTIRCWSKWPQRRWPGQCAVAVGVTRAATARSQRQRKLLGSQCVQSPVRSPEQLD